MHGHIRLGNVLGIRINIDWSWIFIFLLVTWNLAVGVFPDLHPEWSPAVTVVMAVAAALLFFASVLAHELAHSLVARAEGLPVRDITLFLFGGVSNIQREPASPEQEFLMAIVGPLTSIVLGVVFLALGAALAAAGGARAALGADPTALLARVGPIPTLLLWLGPINIVLGAFNLIPGFPLDGGRVLRSVLWKLTHNLRLATRWASWIGQAVAWLFILAGIAMVFGVNLPLFGQGLVGGLWLVFIGWFLNSAAIQSYQQVVVGDLLEGVPVERLMSRNPVSVSPDMSVSSLVDERLMRTDEHAFPVVQGDELVGLVCLEDVRRIARDAWQTTRVADIMTPSARLITADPREPADQALNELSRKDVRQIPVVENGHLVGMLRRRDILRWLQLHSDLHGAA